MAYSYPSAGSYSQAGYSASQETPTYFQGTSGQSSYLPAGYSGSTYCKHCGDEIKQVDNFCADCVLTHDESYGRPYVWLDALGYGPMTKAWFQEPAGEGDLKPYNPETWKVHCRAVNHGSNLYESHVRAFVDPSTRFAKMVFQFGYGKNSVLVEATAEFYRLEHEYFQQKRLCSK